jgi:hypothetical protein
MVERALAEVVQNLKISKPTNKTTKTIKKVSKALHADLKNEMKKQIKNATTPSKTNKLLSANSF